MIEVARKSKYVIFVIFRQNLVLKTAERNPRRPYITVALKPLVEGLMQDIPNPLTRELFPVKNERQGVDVKKLAAVSYGTILPSVGYYVIPWESRVNSCHLRFSCSEFYNDSKKIGCHFFRSP